jgi:hypothetical protein
MKSDIRHPSMKLRKELQSSVIRYVVATIAGFAVLAIAMELTGRLIGLPSGGKGARRIYNLDSERIGEFIPKSKTEMIWPPETRYSVTINSFGCRGSEPQGSDLPWIICVGDSQTFGYGIADDQSWPEILKKRLSKKYRILNVSCGAWVIDDELAALKRIIPKLSPSHVLVLLPPCGYYINPRSKTSTHISRTRKREKKRRSSLRRRLWEATALSEIKFYAKAWQHRLTLEGYGNYPPTARRTFSFETDFTEADKRYRVILMEFINFVRSKSIELRFACTPFIKECSVESFEYEAAPLQSFLQKHKQKYIDLLKPFNSLANPRDTTLYPWDLHLSPEAHRIVAGAFFQSLEE